LQHRRRGIAAVPERRDGIMSLFGFAARVVANLLVALASQLAARLLRHLALRARIRVLSASRT
jgi:hypothetical protein